MWVLIGVGFLGVGSSGYLPIANCSIFQRPCTRRRFHTIANYHRKVNHKLGHCVESVLKGNFYFLAGSSASRWKPAVFWLVVKEPSACYLANVIAYGCHCHGRATAFTRRVSFPSERNCYWNRRQTISQTHAPFMRKSVSGVRGPTGRF
jgi:hypothetical protein